MTSLAVVAGPLRPTARAIYPSVCGLRRFALGIRRTFRERSLTTYRAPMDLDARRRLAVNQRSGMRYWSFRQAAMRASRRPPLRWVAVPTYSALVTSELALQRFIDRVAPPRSAGLDDVTVMIKTFERPHALARLVESIRRLYPALRVIVVDDSRAPTRLPGVETVVLPFDSGVSAGRNAGLARVQTPYFVLADDDFVFCRRTRLARTVAIMRAHPSIDVAGGVVVDPRHRRALGGGPEDPGPRGSIGGLERRELIRNFFVGRTESVRRIGWDDALKRVDHADFFGRARGVLTVVEDPELVVLHAKTPFDTRYMAHRLDVAFDMALLRRRWDARPR